MKSNALYDVVIARTREPIATGLSEGEAKVRCRDWNSRASTATWATVERHRLKPELLEEPADSAKIGFLPTLDQIREACLAIQAEWSDGERRSRIAYGWEGGRP